MSVGDYPGVSKTCRSILTMQVVLVLSLVLAFSVPLSVLAAAEPIEISATADSSIHLPPMSIPADAGPKSHVMLLGVPDWVEVTNSKRTGQGMWMFEPSALNDVRLKLGAKASGDSKITVLIYVDSTGEMHEQNLLLKIAQKPKLQETKSAKPSSGSVTDRNASIPNSDDLGTSIEFPLSPSSREVVRSENLMLIDLPDSLSVLGGLRIGKGMWLVDRENVANARLIIQDNATGRAVFRIFSVGAGGKVHARTNVSIDLSGKKLDSPRSEVTQITKAEVKISDQLAKQDNVPYEEEAQINWKDILEKQKKGASAGEAPGNAPAASVSPAATDNNSAEANDDELLVMGRFLVKECTTCHNVYAKDVGIPVMAGLTVDRFIDTIDLYRRGRRDNKVMQSIANSLSDKETRALGLYLARVNPGDAGNAKTDAAEHSPVDSEESLLGLAKVLVRDCTTCHSIYGNDVGIPVMIGLPVDRFENTIDLYRRKKRSNKVMQSVAGSLTERETHALALYLSRINPDPKGAVAERPTSPASEAPKKIRRTTRKADAEQFARISSWVERAQSMLDNGSIASARLLLRRAAEYGDAQAALLIGSSYDPNVLKWDPTTGIAAEPLQARKWYLEAKALGAGPEVDRRLANLPVAPR